MDLCPPTFPVRLTPVISLSRPEPFYHVESHLHIPPWSGKLRRFLRHLSLLHLTTAYILVAIQFEERDRMRQHPEYAAYRQQVPMLLSRLPVRTTGAAPAHR